jgi:hypothetical protein
MLLVMPNRQRKKWTHHINLNLLYLEAQDDGPYQAENETGIPINNIFCTNTFQSNLKKGMENSKTFCLLE